MAKRKANEPTPAAEETESVQRVEAPSEVVSGRISLRVSQAELSACIERQKHKLVSVIRDPNTPPVDGAIATIVAALDALARIDPEPVNGN
jgi:hypothetical protein